MTAFLESLALWLVDFLALSTALLALSLAARVVVRRPGPRVALAWGTWLGIATIALLTALPAWPRVTLEDLIVSPDPPVAIASDHQVSIVTGAAEEVLASVVTKANERGIKIRSIDIREPNLEAVFLQLTGRALRD